MFKIFKKITALAMAAVTAGALGLNAFAGGPMPQEDELAAEKAGSTKAVAVQGSLPNTLKLGVTYRIMSRADTYLGNDEYEYYVLNVEDGADVNQTPINLKIDDEKNRDLKQQKFWLIPSGSYYKLGVVCSKGCRVLDAYRPLSDGCSVDIWSNTDDEAQQLVIGGNASSGYTIRLKNGLALTAVNANDDGEVQFKNYTGATNQKWTFFDESTAASILIKRPPSSYAQNKYSWCWAAAAKKVAENNGNGLNTKMTGDAQELDYIDELHYNEGSKPKYWGEGGYGKPLADGAQRAIVIQVHGNDLDGIGRISPLEGIDDMEKALEYAHPNNADYTRIGSPGANLSEDNRTIFKSKVQSEVQNGRYLLAGFTSSGGTGHLAVITDYNPTTQQYKLYDPWRGDEPKATGDDIFNHTVHLAGAKNYRLEYFYYMA